MRLKDKVAIITGGSRGIGYATAEKFLQEGAKVIITASSPATAERAAASLKEKYPHAAVAGISPDLADMNSVRQAFGDVISQYGCVDILVISNRDIKYAVSKLSAVSHRLELKPFINGSLLIDDAYNANPSGSIEAVNVISSFDGFRKIIVTPGLVELGDNEYKANCALGKAAAEKCDVLIFVGEKRSIPLVDGAKSVDSVKEENIHVVASFKDAMTLLRQLVNDKCVVLFENDLPDNYAG